MGITTSGHDVEDLQEKVIGLFGEHEAEERTALGGRVVAQVLVEQLDFAADDLVGIYPVPLPAGYSSVSLSCLNC